jgi:glycosyltransferase involved in cell wall biosynthesis
VGSHGAAVVMRILHVMSGPLFSGAGRGALALHEALLAKGVNSQMIGRLEPGLPTELNVISVPMRAKVIPGLRNRLYMRNLQRRFGPVGMFHPVSHGLALHRMPAWRDADLIHIQWASASTLGPAFWRHLAQETRPVVWTLRDMWVMSGGCHFSGNCRGYESGCTVCPILRDAPQQITSRDIQFKRDHLGSSSFVAISEHIAECARRSVATRDRRIDVIPNSVDPSLFTLADRREARASLGLDQDTFIVAFGALSLAEKRKGSETLAHLLKLWRDRADLRWLAFGKNLDQIADPVPGNCTWFGPVSDPVQLNRIYAAADLFLMPSLQESFGKVTVEAHYSGTPVLAYADTPAEEILTDTTGWLVPHGDAPAMAARLAQVHALPRTKLAEMGRMAREKALSRFSSAIIADRHIDLYRELLGAAPGASDEGNGL